MKIEVKVRGTVYPAKPRPPEVLELSNNDQVMPRCYSLFLYIFHHHEVESKPNFMSTEILKDSLSQALTAFYPLAGRFMRRSNGGVDVDCNNKGVDFLEACADGTLKDLDEFQPNSVFPLLAPEMNAESGGGDISELSLLLAQVTRFECGGVALVLKLHHHVGDGAAFSHFVTSWAEISRGVEISVPPIFDRLAMKARHPPRPEFEHLEYTVIPPDMSWMESGLPAMTAKMVEFDREDIECLKQRAGQRKDGGSFTGFEVLAGHVWRCITKARGIDPIKDVQLGLAVDGRKRFNEHLSKGYFGNVNFYGCAQSNAGELMREPLLYAASCVHQCIARITNEYMRSALDWIEIQDGPCTINASFTNFHSGLAITSWIRFSSYEVDFGWGTPVFLGIPVNGFSGLVILLPTPGGDGSMRALVGLCTEHMRELASDPEFYPVKTGNLQ